MGTSRERFFRGHSAPSFWRGGVADSPQHPKRRQRGFVHVLLLVFTILGISIWGISEIIQRAQESKNKATQTAVTTLNEAKRLLINYALIAPPRLEVDNRAGRYNALVDRGVAVPYRYFSLPCPDVARPDNDLNGVSDILTPANAISDCGAKSDAGGNFLTPLVAQSRTGRLPWRTFSGQTGGDYVYVQGLGTNITDHNGDRFWYAVSRNLVRRTRAINPHWLLRQSSEWLTLVETPSDKVISRVAALVVSPGNGQIFTHSNITVGSFSRFTEVGEVDASGDLFSAFAYLDGGEAGEVDANAEEGFAYFFDRSVADERPTVYVENPPLASVSDRIAYITVEELAAQGGAGIEEISDRKNHFFDLIEGRGEFFGVQELMRAHFARYGYLPAPAGLGDTSALRRTRAAGVLGMIEGETNSEELADGYSVQRGLVTETGAVTTVLVPVRNIRKVYLQENTRLRSYDANDFGDLLPPYNLPLYAMDTALNQTPLLPTIIATLLAEEYYPQELFGYRETPSVFVTAGFYDRDDPEPRAIPISIRVFRSALSRERVPPPFVREQDGIIGVNVFVALAEPVLAYIAGEQLSTAVRINGDGDIIAQSPQYGVQVQLPVGTRLTIQGDDGFVLELPQGLVVNDASYDALTRSWTLSEQLPQPVRFIGDSSDQVITLQFPIADLPITSGDTGFFPVDDLSAEFLDTNNTVVFGAQRLSGSGEAMTVHGGVTLAHIHPMSYLPVAMQFYTNQRLAILPFPPAGLPAAPSDTPHSSDNIDIPSPLFVNYVASTVVRPTVFTMPAGTQIYYPPGSEINLGTDFAFPPGSKALLPAGATMEVDILPDSTLPGGRRVEELAFAADGVPPLREVTFYHGAMMELSGPSHTTIQPGTRVVLQNGVGIDSDQELFDIELQTSYTAENAAGTVTFGGGVLQPLTGRQLNSAIMPIPITGTIDVSRVRMRFLTRPRNVPLITPNYILPIITVLDNDTDLTVSIQVVTTVTASDPLTFIITATVLMTQRVATVIVASGIPVTVTTFSPPLIDNLILPGDELHNLPVGVQTGNDSEASGGRRFRFKINEETHFILPPGATFDFPKRTVSSDLGDMSLVDNFVFPIDTVIYDSSFDTLESINIAGRDGVAVLESPLTVPLARAISDRSGNGRGIVTDELMMLLDNDITLGGGDIIPANSVIDVVRGVAWPPGSIRSLPSVAEDLRAVPSRQAVMYFGGGVVLTNIADFSLVAEYEGNRNIVEIQYDEPATLSLSWALHSGLSAADVNVTEGVAEVGAGGDVRLPAGSFIIIPAGSTLDFLSPNRHEDTGFSPDTADVAHLPPDATAVLPMGAVVTLDTISDSVTEVIDSVSGETLTLTTYITMDIVVGGAGQGAVHLRLGHRNAGLAMVAHSDLLPISPIIDFPGDTYLIDKERTAALTPEERHTNIIPGGSRGDIFGNITNRDGVDFAVNMLPADTGEFLRNFPMVYAVAPRCRLEGGGGDSCASGSSGLEFDVGIGEEVVLEEDIVAAGNIFITVASEEQPDRTYMNVTVWSLSEFYKPASLRVAKGSGDAEAIWVDVTTGLVQLRAATFTGARAPPAVIATDVMILSAVGESQFADSVGRVYMLDSTVSLAAVNETVLQNAHYANMNQITIHVGGYTSGRESTAAASIVLTATTTRDAVNLTTNFQIGYGALVISDGSSQTGEEIFGRDSYIKLTVGGALATLPLEEYFLVRADAYRANIEVASRYASFDYAGNIITQADVGENISFSGAPIGASIGEDTPNATLATPLPPIMVAAGTGIDMEQGYLWQGYLNSQGGRAAVTMNFSRNEPLVNTGALESKAFLRVHPQAALLNFWGSGAERLEGMDSRSVSRSPGRLVMTPTKSRGSADAGEVTGGIGMDNFIVTGQNEDEWLFDRDIHYTDEYDNGVYDYFLYNDVSTGANDVIYASQPNRPSGFRSPIYGGGTHLTILLRVRDSTGAVVADNVEARWTPQVTPLTYRFPVPTAPPFADKGTPIPGFLTWGYNNSPFQVLNQSYAQRDTDVWALRQITNPYDTSAAGRIDDNARLSFGINGSTVTVNFNPPPFQMTGKRLALHHAVEYPKFAHIPIAILDFGSFKCGDAQHFFGRTGELGFIDRDVTRVPGVLLGSHEDVERHFNGVRVECEGNERLQSFSTRTRRNTIPATYAGPPGGVTILHYPPFSPLTIRGFVPPKAQPRRQEIDYGTRSRTGNTMTVEFELEPSTLPTTYNIHGRVFTIATVGVTRVNVAITSTTRNALASPNSGHTIDRTVQYNDSDVTNLTIFRAHPPPLSQLRTRVQVRQFPRDPSQEVRAVDDNQPQQFVVLRGSPLTAIPNANNPRSYTVPGRYVPSTVFASLPNEPSVDEDMQVSFASGENRAVPLDADMFFYLDRAYNSEPPRGLLPRGDGVSGAAIPRQRLLFGDDFQISGPGAFVPHFGGHTRQVVAQTYAARSRFMSELFNTNELKLHPKYSQVDYTCNNDALRDFREANVKTCHNIYNPNNARYWIPIISGIVAFEGLNISLSGSNADLEKANVVMVLPQPQATIAVAGGGNTVIYAGSLIEPRQMRIRPSIPITVKSKLFIFDEAVAAVDVSPVNAPTPIQMLRPTGQPYLRSWDFNYTPMQVTSGGDTYYVEPKRFTSDGVIDFSNPNRFDGAQYGLPNTCSDRNDFECNPFRADSGEPTGYRIVDGLQSTLRYDGTLARGFLMDEKMSGIMADYYAGRDVFTTARGFVSYYPHKAYKGFSAFPTQYFTRALPVLGNEVTPIGNPFSWHWLHRQNIIKPHPNLGPVSVGGNLIPIGGARQFISPDYAPPAASSDIKLVFDPRGNSCGGLGVQTEQPVLIPGVSFQAELGLLNDPFDDLPCAGFEAHFWVGLHASSSSTQYPHPIDDDGKADDDEFVALRLPHLINLPSTEIDVFAHSGGTPYPSDTSRFFRFPDKSFANILNVDAASWESVHPYASRFLPGLVLNNEGGFYPDSIPSLIVHGGGGIRTIVDRIRSIIANAEEMEVRQINDGHRRVDISGRRVLHYTHTESAPGNYAYTNTPVYTNVWIRLLHGGVLQGVDGSSIYLPSNTILNPILGTYLPGEGESTSSERLVSNYQAYAEIGAPSVDRDPIIVHPALVIPKGVTVRVGSRGADITNVKAAAFFSLTPLQGVQCAYGGIDGEFFSAGLQNTVTLNQSRDGVVGSGETAFETAAGKSFSLANPCAWLDDKENTDGDRFFVYRSRRRYVEPYKTRVIANDRTYLLGGTLTLRFNVES